MIGLGLCRGTRHAEKRKSLHEECWVFLIKPFQVELDNLGMFPYPTSLVLAATYPSVARLGAVLQVREIKKSVYFLYCSSIIAQLIFRPSHGTISNRV
jgi:hypothetical protein